MFRLYAFCFSFLEKKFQSRLDVNFCKFTQAHWHWTVRFLNVQHQLGICFKSSLWGPVTFTPVAEQFAGELSLPVLNQLDLLWPGFVYPTFVMWLKSVNELEYCYGYVWFVCKRINAKINLSRIYVHTIIFYQPIWVKKSKKLFMSNDLAHLSRSKEKDIESRKFRKYFFKLLNIIKLDPVCIPLVFTSWS